MSASESLKTIVGQQVYTTWTKMLRALVPDGRTHRIAPMVAGMLQYATTVAYEKYGGDPEDGSAAQALLASEEFYDPEQAVEVLELLEQLFQDAGVEYARVSSRGDRYSVIESAVYEFIHWYDMPWES
jgi:hypothetical protein